MELLGPVPVGPLTVQASVVRPGRSVELCEATAYDEQRHRACARATAWLFPATTEGPQQVDRPLPHSPADGVPKDPPASWSRGYLDAIEWRWGVGAGGEPGPRGVRVRPRGPLRRGGALGGGGGGGGGGARRPGVAGGGGRGGRWGGASR